MTPQTISFEIYVIIMYLLIYCVDVFVFIAIYVLTMHVSRDYVPALPFTFHAINVFIDVNSCYLVLLYLSVFSMYVFVF